MIGKQSQHDGNGSRIKLIANKRKSLEEQSAQIQEEIRSCFEEIVEVLRSRERQLLRQAEAIHRQQLSLVETSSDFLPSSIVVLDGRDELEEHIRQFGNIETQGLNGITVKDVEPYKVVDYQDANKDHVSFDKSIVRQEIGDRPKLPRCRDFVSDYRTFRISSLPSALFIENQLQDSRNVKADTLMYFENALSRCSPFLIIKRKLGLTHVSLDGLHALDKASSRKIQSFDISCKSEESCKLNASANETPKEIEPQELKKIIERKKDSELIKYPKAREKNYEHPMQVQQWLRQILAETEIEPVIHEVGQFSEISKVKLCD